VDDETANRTGLVREPQRSEMTPFWNNRYAASISIDLQGARERHEFLGCSVRIGRSLYLFPAVTPMREAWTTSAPYEQRISRIQPRNKSRSTKRLMNDDTVANNTTVWTIG